VGQKNNALQTLHDTITNKRQQRNWSQALEQVMYKYLDLAVEMRQGRKVKDALINYRNTCQQINVGSLEEVIRHLVDCASKRAEEAKQSADVSSKIDDVGDLEAEASPEELVLSYVSGEKSADRTDRELVTPWFKFLWETHRNVLDVLRNNSRLETLYAAAARRAFAFCVAYRRTTEFRRLCDILRNHLGTLIKYRDQGGRDRTDLSVSATWELYIEMRFDQLKSACELHLWAEAFRSVEDIQGLMALFPSNKGIKTPKASLMAVYYSRLTQIFTRSEARLYNAYAWYRLFTFSRSYNKSLSPEDVTSMATNVVLSALGVLPYDSSVQSSSSSTLVEHERASKMAGILGFSIRDSTAKQVSGGVVPGAPVPVLSRAALLSDIERKGLLTLVPPPIKAVYDVLEGDFNPLVLCKTLAPLLEPFLKEGSGLESYVPYLQQVALAKTVRQLSEVYSVMRVADLSALAPFGWSPGTSEALVVEAVRQGYLYARFDHRNGTVHFGRQELESERVKGHIAAAARRLSKASIMIGGARQEAAREAKRIAAVRRAMETAEEENARALARKIVIERKKEEAERLMLERELEAEAARAAAEAVAREAEERRQAAERARREEERIKREFEEDEMARIRAELAARGKKVGDNDKVDMATLKAEIQREEDIKAAEMRRKLTKLSKQMDHLERAKREEEEPLRKEAAQQRLADEEESWERDQQSFKAEHKAAWEKDLEMKDRVQRMEEEANKYGQMVLSRRAAEFEQLRQRQLQAREEARLARKEARELARKREYVRRCRYEVEERKRAEEAALREEEAQRKSREAAERQRKLDEIAEKQRAREAEIEAKKYAESGREDMRAPPSAVPPSAAPASAPKPGGGYVPPHLRNKAEQKKVSFDTSVSGRDEDGKRYEDGKRDEDEKRSAPAPFRPSRVRDTQSTSEERGGAYRPPAAKGGTRW
jgi:translation initiation factor 3 subunit A